MCKPDKSSAHLKDALDFLVNAIPQETKIFEG
jgi:Golgi nucleoside diphosphatase